MVVTTSRGKIMTDLLMVVVIDDTTKSKMIDIKKVFESKDKVIDENSIRFIQLLKRRS